MSEYILYIATALIVALSLVALNPAQALRSPATPEELTATHFYQPVANTADYD